MKVMLATCRSRVKINSQMRVIVKMISKNKLKSREVREKKQLDL